MMMDTRREPGVLGKAIALVVGAVLFVLGLVFSVALLVVAAVLGVAAFGYFWWKTRALRKALRERRPATSPGGQVFEGEAVVIEERQESRTRRALSDKPQKS